MTGVKRARLGAAVVALLTLALPGFLGESALSTYVLLELTAIVTLGVSLLMGYAGQVSLGQAAFYAIGAYAAGILATRGYPTLLGLLAGPLVAALVAAVVGIPILRLRGHHLSFATLAVQLICFSIISELKSVTGGDTGLLGIPRLGAGAWQITSDRGYAYLAWAAVVLVVLVTRNVIASRPGRGLRALATSEVAAESCGVPVARYKLAVFSLSAAFAGLAGGIYAYYVGYLSTGSFPVLLSFEYVVMAVVGGLGTITGALVGATFVTILVQGLNRVATASGMPSYAPAVLSYAVYGALLVVPALYLPEGIVPTFAAWWKRQRAVASSGSSDVLR